VANNYSSTIMSNTLHKIKRQKKTHTGFTLIELLVVIAIIGLLASVVMTSLGVSRARAEIAKVLTEYKSVASALELYRQNNAGNYPGNIDEAVSIEDLIQNNSGLLEYIKKSPDISSRIATNATMYYILNSKENGNGIFLCGEQGTNQEYVLYFNATPAAEVSGLFKSVYSLILGGGNTPTLVDGVLCVPINQE
jgi:prepilin-type N-terminal cleavage/methylation domain-containing protein